MNPAPTDATFSITPAPCGRATPLVFASPHSGTLYPEDMGAAEGLSQASLRSAEDAAVDRLLAASGAAGAVLIAGRIGRAYVDLNRAPDDLDPVLIVDCPDGPPPGLKTLAGYGVVPRLAGDGAALYDRRLTLAEARGRIARVHAPYHAALVETDAGGAGGAGPGGSDRLAFHAGARHGSERAGRGAGRSLRDQLRGGADAASAGAVRGSGLARGA